MTASWDLSPDGSDPRLSLTPCKKCGEVHVRYEKPTCRAHLKSGKACRQFPIAGTVVCRAHGGAIPAVKAKAAERRRRYFLEGKIANMLHEAEIQNEHPLDGLLEVVQRAGSMMRVLGAMVGELDDDPVPKLWGLSDDGAPIMKMSGIFGMDHNGDTAQHILVQMYGQWADRYARACKLALDANIDERLVRNATATSDRMFSAIAVAFRSAGLTPEQTDVFRTALAQELRKLAGPLEHALPGGTPV